MVICKSPVSQGQNILICKGSKNYGINIPFPFDSNNLAY